MTMTAQIALNAIINFLENEKNDLTPFRITLSTKEQPQAFGIYAEALMKATNCN